MDTIVGETEEAESPGYVTFEREGKVLSPPGGEARRTARSGSSSATAPAAGRPTAVPGSFTPSPPREGDRRARLQQGDQPAVRVHPLRDLPAGTAAEPAEPGDRGRRAEVRDPARQRTADESGR